MESVRTFPARDRAFAAEVQRVIEAVDGRSDEDSVERATAELRRLYPNAALRWSDEMGGYARRVCYAFREGRVRLEDSQRERLYDALARSRQIGQRARELLGKSGRGSESTRHDR